MPILCTRSKPCTKEHAIEESKAFGLEGRIHKVGEGYLPGKDKGEFGSAYMKRIRGMRKGKKKDGEVKKEYVELGTGDAVKFAKAEAANVKKAKKAIKGVKFDTKSKVT